MVDVADAARGVKDGGAPLVLLRQAAGLAAPHVRKGPRLFRAFVVVAEQLAVC